MVEKESGHKLRVLNTDNDREFIAYYTDEGIRRHFFAPYSLQQNGVVEGHKQTVVATTQALLKQRDADHVLGGGSDDNSSSA